jgi:restriction endonuclease S subunit
VNPDRIFLVRKGEIEGRLDPNFYLPIFRVSNRELFRTLNEVSKYILHPPEYPRMFSERGLQLIRSQNVRPLGIDLSENPVFFSNDFLKDKKFIFARKGDILIVRSGVNAGDVAVVEEDQEAAIIGADTLLCKCREEVIPKFLQVYFYTDFGKRQILRHTTGATNKHLNSENLRKVLIPNVDLGVQKRAIALFEESLEVKRAKEAEARSLLDGIDAYLLDKLGIALLSETDTEKTFFIRYSNLSGGRFDPSFYKPNYQKLVAAIKRQPFRRLRELVGFSSELWNQVDFFDSTFPYIEISEIDIEKGEINNINYIQISEAPSRAKMIVRDGDIIVSTTRPSRGAIAKITEEQDFSIASTGFAVIRFSDENLISKSFLHSILKHRICLLQMEQRSSGGNYPAITQEELSNILIPLPPLEAQEKIAAQIQAIRERVKELDAEARAGVERAKAEVEKMILGEGSKA